MFCHITKDALNVMKIVINNALPKLQLLPFCFAGQCTCSSEFLWAEWPKGFCAVLERGVISAYMSVVDTAKIFLLALISCF